MERLIPALCGGASYCLGTEAFGEVFLQSGHEGAGIPRMSRDSQILEALVQKNEEVWGPVAIVSSHTHSAPPRGGEQAGAGHGRKAWSDPRQGSPGQGGAHGSSDHF